MTQNYMSLSDSFKNEMKLIASNLLEASGGKNLKSFLITSSRNGEGKTLVSLSMAKRLAEEEHLKVLLIDTNIQSPILHEIFDLALAPGILDVINNDIPLKDAIQKTDINGLSVLTLGENRAYTTKLLRKAHFETIFKDIAPEYDYIIADGSSVLGASEVIMICSIFQAVLLVVECELTKAPVVANSKDRINAAGGNLLGVVLNRRKFYIPDKFYGK
jgi:protein-tyrosine kinase